MTPDRLTLTAVRRETIGRTPEQVRRAGFIPAVLYGHGVTTLTIAVNTRALEKLLPALSTSTLMNLSLPNTKATSKVLVHEVQRHPLTGVPIHVDFYQVKLTEQIRAKVPLAFAGVSPAVKDLAGTLVKSADEVNVEALPQDLPEHLIVDVSRLRSFDDRITIGDLPVPGGVKVLDDAHEVVAVVTRPRTEEELQELETEVEETGTAVKTEAEEKKAEKEQKAAEEDSTKVPEQDTGAKAAGKR